MFNILSPLLPPAGLVQHAPGLHGSADALALSELAMTLAPERRLLVVLADTATNAERLREEISWFAPNLRIALFADWETLPYDHFSPHHDLVSERLASLYQISHRQCDLLIVAVTTALYRLPPTHYLAAFSFFLRRGEKLDRNALRRQLSLAGYQAVQQVLSPGEYCVRGGLIDLYPMGSSLPYRIDLFEDEIETIKAFDVDTQRTVYPVNEIRLLPAREFPTDEAARTLFRQNFREKFEGDPSKSQIYKDVSQGVLPGGIEYYLPLFFETLASFTDYLPNDSALCLTGTFEKSLTEFWREITDRYRLLKGDRDRPLLVPSELFLTIDEFFSALKPFSRLIIDDTSTPGFSTPPPSVAVERRATQPLRALTEWLTHTDHRVLICAESMGRRETILSFFAEYGLHPAVMENYSALLVNATPLAITVAPLRNGFIIPEAKLAVLTETELYADSPQRMTRRRAKGETQVDGVLRNLAELRNGDAVVHEQYGIGRYHGLITLDLGEGSTEFLHLEYAKQTKLYVPVSNLHLISRYSGASPEAAPLHSLGSDEWEKAKRKAAQQARDTAAELLNLYAQRAARQGHSFKINAHDYDTFASSFDFTETPDQAAAIAAVIKDLSSGKPMDRLVCGDVGFGKTEVALRAAFIALMDGRQVALLVPTTLLAEQHFLTFSDRFAEWPVKLAELSRFRSSKEVKQTLLALAEGRVDLVIGTHRLIQSDVQFKRLGLVIIDEEHRFGVRQKEQLKKLRAEVDVLTLTATPIPRTLAMSLEGLRDFSVIATAPERRLAIKTFVTPYSAGIIREAGLRELKRGGQIYFLHNDIDTIEDMHSKLAAILPEARSAVAHGQMHERELERVMRDFYQQRCNLLLCSTIIETGIDVPNANTIIIHRADKFGLAQLHQLRGRVGRSHHQAYAYLLVPEEGQLTAQAKKRLEAIQMMEELGSGFYLAMHDLEIRGAGEVLGDAQSGEMQAIGFQLYSEMLTAAVDALKAGREPDLQAPLGVTTEINLHSPALLPDTYCDDVHARLVLYKQLANCTDVDELARMQEELIDRFGLLPESAKTLLASHRLRTLAKPLGITKIDAASERIFIYFVAEPPFDPLKLIELIQRDRRYQFAGPNRIKIERQSTSLNDRVQIIDEFILKLC